MFIPYRVDVPMHRWPISNFVIIALAVVAFIYQSSLSDDELWPLILNGWRPLGLFAHMWLHGDWLHLIGNMLFLWVFGNAVCAKVGNLVYPVLYVAFGLAAAAGPRNTGPRRPTSRAVRRRCSKQWPASPRPASAHGLPYRSRHHLGLCRNKTFRARPAQDQLSRRRRLRRPTPS